MQRYSKPTAYLLLALAVLIGCAGGRRNTAQSSSPSDVPVTPAATQHRAASSDSLNFLIADSATKTATLTLEATRPAGSSSALINGYRAGEARVIVPLNWTVRWTWRNADPSSAHSLVWMVQREKIPLEGGRAAFTNALTRSVIEGLAAGQTDQSTFVADEAGWYWLLCGVPSHALEGEWLELHVNPEARTARAQLKPKG